MFFDVQEKLWQVKNYYFAGLCGCERLGAVEMLACGTAWVSTRLGSGVVGSELRKASSSGVVHAVLD